MGMMQVSLRRSHQKEVDATSRLASGDRLNRAKNDSASLAVSTKLDSLVMGRRVVARSINVKLHIADMSDGALETINERLQRARELAVQSASEVLPADERAHIEREFGETMAEIDRIANTTQYEHEDLLLNAAGTSQTVHIGIRGDSDHAISYTKPHANLTGLGLTGLNVSTVAGARTSLSSLDTARNSVSEMRADIGAFRNRLESALNSNIVAMEGEASSVSKMRDADMAFEVSMKTQAGLMSQAAMSVMGQAKQLQKGTIQQLVS